MDTEKPIKYVTLMDVAQYVINDQFPEDGFSVTHVSFSDPDDPKIGDLDGEVRIYCSKSGGLRARILCPLTEFMQSYVDMFVDSESSLKLKS